MQNVSLPHIHTHKYTHAYSTLSPLALTDPVPSQSSAFAQRSFTAETTLDPKQTALLFNGDLVVQMAPWLKMTCASLVAHAHCTGHQYRSWKGLSIF